MRLALSCGELRASGGRAVGLGLLGALARRSWGHDLTAYVPDDPGYAALVGGSLRLVAEMSGRGLGRLRAHRALRHRLIADRQDAVLMMGNLGLVDPPCPQAVYVQNAWGLYPESPAWRRCSVRERFYRRVRNAYMARGLRGGFAAAQTPVMVERLHRQFGIPYDRLALLPNSITATGSSDETEWASPAARLIQESGHSCRVLCVARYMVHKNLEILLPIADKLIELGRRDIGIFVTLDRSQGPGARRFLEGSLRNGRDRIIRNLGEVPPADVASCYQAADAMLLPTLLESFSGTYADAMRHGVPIITSDLDFARAVCGPAAAFIDPEDPTAIVAALLSLESDRDGWRGRSTTGRERLARLAADWDTIAARAVEFLEAVARGAGTSHLLDSHWMSECAALPSN
jgi:glycosyltransferase involved in cell wall biosynthesis